ncbi:phosphoribosyltransferase [Patescibacteria group bacterium]|nr:phosphoribosyltransferase [Patescibacteria group bacterium]
MRFESRKGAGRLLADRLKKYGKDCLVLAIPRGGVVIGAEIARALSCTLDVIIIRKLGAPGNPELAIGATTSRGGKVLDQKLIDKLQATSEYVNSELEKQILEAKRRESLYTKEKKLDLLGKTVILVDDGIATGATVEAAIHAVREEAPTKVILAIPVAPSQTVERLRIQVDELVVLSTPEQFWAIGEFYDDFPQVSDEEVLKILQETSK